MTWSCRIRQDPLASQGARAVNPRQKKLSENCKKTCMNFSEGNYTDILKIEGVRLSRSEGIIELSELHLKLEPHRRSPSVRPNLATAFVGQHIHNYTILVWNAMLATLSSRRS
jgi:hypothetical protein